MQSNSLVDFKPVHDDFTIVSGSRIGHWRRTPSGVMPIIRDRGPDGSPRAYQQGPVIPFVEFNGSLERAA
jgi:hypothetical protein